jgi:hypothetical protein
VDVVKVMASGGAITPGSDVMLTQFTTDELRLIVDRVHEHGLPITAHAHGTPAVEQVIELGVDGIEHCSCVTDRGFGDASDETVAALARSGIAVCPTIGVDTRGMQEPPPALMAMLDRMGLTLQQMLQDRWDLVGRLHRAGCASCPGSTPGSRPPSGTACSHRRCANWCPRASTPPKRCGLPPPTGQRCAELGTVKADLPPAITLTC